MCATKKTYNVHIINKTYLHLLKKKGSINQKRANVYGKMYHRNEFKGLKMLLEKSEFLSSF